MNLRRRLLRLTRNLAGIALVLAVVTAGAGYAMARRAWPQTRGSMTLRGLDGDVEIRRDAWGVPQVYASTEHDLFFGQGFVHAQDRLWQMHLTRAMARGELAAMFGEGALESDRTVRTLGLPGDAVRDLSLLAPETHAILRAYADGVNAFLATGSPLPPEFALAGARPEPWQPLDVVLVGEAISLSMAQNSFFEIMRARLAARAGDAAVNDLMGPYPESAPVIVGASGGELGRLDPGTERVSLPSLLWSLRGLAGGSNAWAIHGSRTATGRPLLANDTHLGLSLPSVWYENGLHGGRYSVVGFSLPGAPFVAVGHNERLAWGVTNLLGDVQDLYWEKLDSATAPARYEARGEWRPLEIDVEAIPVKGRAPEELRILRTEHGPIINAALGAKELGPLSLRWSLTEGSHLFDALAALDRAGDWDAFRGSLRSWDSPSLSFVYADVDGHIGYQATGRIPVRPAGVSGTAPVPGWTGDREWKGFLPFDELPFERDPGRGFVVSANNKVVGDDYPGRIGFDWAEPYRAERITEVLASSSHVTLEDTRALQADTLSLPARTLVPHLLSVAPRSDVERAALDVVRSWDFRFDEGSAGASIYYAWYNRLLDGIVGDELGRPLLADFREIALTQTPMFARMLASGDGHWFDDVRTPERETRDVVVQRAFADAVAWLTGRLGADPRRWEWGHLHTVTFAHQPFGRSGVAPLERLFNSREVPVGGERCTVDATAPDPDPRDPDKPYAVAFGPALRFIADLADLERSRSAVPVGQSGLLFHPHREDQVEAWRRVELHPMLFGRDAVTAGASDVLWLRRPPDPGR